MDSRSGYGNWLGNPHDALLEVNTVSPLDRLTLRAALIIDAVVSGAILVPFVAFLAFLVARETLARTAVWTAAALNLAWVGGSIVLLVGGWFEPNGFGYAVVIVQAATVALLAWAQIVKVVEEEAHSWGSVAQV